jgi:type II secretory pathway pseudopilin PulG
MKSFKKAKAAGFSLIELLLVIGFISGALVLAFVTYPKVQATNRANVEAQHIVVLSGGIKNLYTTAQNFGSLTNNVLINAKIVPDDLQVSAPTISNIWGGNITVAPASGTTGGTNLMYTISYTGVPRSECVKLATSVAVNFLKLDIQTTNIFDRTGTGGSVNLDPALVAGTCVDGQVNTIVLTGN